VKGLSIGFGVVFLAVAAGWLWLWVRGRRQVGGRHLPPGTALRDQRRWKVFAPIAVVVFLANAVLWLLRGSGLVH
jgi:hypothetical protein